jgi:hypothetical protein
LPGCDGLHYLDGIAVSASDFDFLYGVGAFRNRGASKDLECLAGFELSVKCRAGCNFTDDSKIRGDRDHVRRAKRISIHSSAIKRRKIDVRENVFGEDPLVRLFQPHGLNSERLDVVEHDAERLIDGDHIRGICSEVSMLEQEQIRNKAGDVCGS